jgi:GrpB-like predicted nucleotidyltransferase (UPF0157 family)
MMIGLEPGVVKLYPYNDEWPRLFQQEKQRLHLAIGHYVLDIQHVGSTSIPGLPAKPIIDIAIAVKDFEEAIICISPIEQLGYVYRGEHGIPRRHYFRKGELRTHHLHLNEIEGDDWKNQILFRDYLRQHPAARQAYAELKTDLARRYARDRERYLREKAPFIEEVIRLARLEKSSKQHET